MRSFYATARRSQSSISFRGIPSRLPNNIDHSTYLPECKLSRSSRKRELPRASRRLDNSWYSFSSSYQASLNYKSRSNHQSRFYRTTPTYTQKTTISFLTDVEGDKEYLQRYVEHSHILRFVPCSTDDVKASGLSVAFPYNHRIDFQTSLTPENDNILVFGGDVCDQGGSDLYVLRQLLMLKAKYPEQVMFILGNRDLNKLRILQELGAPGEDYCPPHKGVYILTGRGCEGDPLLYRDHHDEEGGEHNASHQARTQKPKSLPTDDPVHRLKWMLSMTMGCPRSFDHRKKELEEEGANEPNTGGVVTERHVVESYRQSCHPNGEMGQFLLHADLALHVGPVLFLHGALPLTSHLLQQTLDDPHLESNFWADLTKFMPWLPKGVSAIENGVVTTHQWIEQMNSFARSSLKAWKQSVVQDEAMKLNDAGQDKTNHFIWSTEGGYHTQCDYGALMQYAMGMPLNGHQNPTIVYNRWSDSGGMPSRFMEASALQKSPDSEKEDTLYVRLIQEFFRKTPNLRLICTGHQPQGDMANVICLESTPSSSSGNDVDLNWIVAADTSYSGDVWFWDRESKEKRQVERDDSLSGRGIKAICEVVISWEGDRCCHESIPSVYCHGTLADGTMYKTPPLPMHLDNNTTSVGEQADLEKQQSSPHTGPWWKRAVFEDGSYMLCAGEGHHFWNCIIKPEADCES